MRFKLGLGTGLARGTLGKRAPTPPPAGNLRAARFTNSQIFHGGSVPVQLLPTAYLNEQLFRGPSSLVADAGGLVDTDLLPAQLEPITAGLVFCVGSHPAGSPLLGMDLVSGSAGTLLTSGNLAATNASHGTLKCLESTSLTDGGAWWPSTTELRSITNQRTLAIHCHIDSFGTSAAYCAMLGAAYRATGWTTPFFAQCIQKKGGGSGADLQTIFATPGQNAANSVGGAATGEHWFVVTLDGPAAEARFYVDGALQGSPVGISADPVDWSNQQPVTIFNRSSTSNGEGTDGRCYTAAIWNRVLSAAEVASLFANPRLMFEAGDAALTPEKFVNAQTFRTASLVNPNVALLNPARFANAHAYRAATLVSSGGNGEVGPIEPVDGSALQVAISVGTTPRQTWLGYGWGAGSSSHVAASGYLTRLAANATKLCEDMGAKVVRFHNAPSSEFVSRFKPVWDIIKTHGVDTIFLSDYVYASNPDTSPSAEASAISNAIAAGIPISAVSRQNEPDGGTNNNPYGTSNYTTQVGTDNTNLRSSLDALGRQAVKVLTLEWRHPTDASKLAAEYDHMSGLDRIPSVIGDGCIHIYNKGPDHTIYDQRFFNDGLGFWSTETGDMNAPKSAAQFVTGVNHGTVVELAHIAIANTDDETSKNASQKLIKASGTPNAWYYGLRVLSRAMVRGTRMRLCTSSDRPGSVVVGGTTYPALGTTQASRMLWHSGTSQLQPRQQVAVGKRADSRWVVCAVNYTFGANSPTSFSGGHYAAVTQQLTVTIPELSGADRVFSAQRASQGGTITSGITVNLKNGVMRFTLQPGETIAMTSSI